MSKVVKIAAFVVVVSLIITLCIASVAFATNYDSSGNPDNPGIGPAPSAGDGVSEGPEWDIPIPNGPQN